MAAETISETLSAMPQMAKLNSPTIYTELINTKLKLTDTFLKRFKAETFFVFTPTMPAQTVKFPALR